MKILFIDDNAFDSFFDWTCDDKATAKKIKKLITDIEREPYDGLGKPEPLKYGLSGYWSRRIDEEHRLVYKVENDTIVIVSCKGHYE
jgi:toxin YoeB